MLTTETARTTRCALPRLGRRSLFSFAVLAAASASHANGVLAAPAPSEAIATIARLNDTLLTVMKAGRQVSFQQRYAILAPVIGQAFDLPAVLAVSVGPRWATLPTNQRQGLLDAFRSYTVANYAANFNSYDGQTISILPSPRTVGTGDVVVQTTIASATGNTNNLGYVMRRTPAGWKVVDVLVDGAISRVAVQRSDFHGLLSSGRGEALLASLQRKTFDLSGGTLG
jgi:phospholipid transport system substrate-binding protein